MALQIAGITKSGLWAAWKYVRKEMRHSSVRDVVDFVEYDIDPDVWIARLLTQIAGGRYEPKSPRRFTLAKSTGFSRWMALPAIPDMVLFRAIAAQCYRKAKRREHRHVYFERAALSKAASLAAQEAAATMAELSSYPARRQRRFFAWLHYDQYRRHLILKRVYPFIVVTDISAFFDSILYSKLLDALTGLADSRQLGLLFFLLERLSPRDAYTESPRVGLPVDEFDCSRVLAHLVLFSHDDRMVDVCGEDAYVRWMDDQNIGVTSRAAGLRVLAFLGHSLARLHLAPNQKKTSILTLAQARRHFHLDTNARLDALEGAKIETSFQRRGLSRAVRLAWKRAVQYEGAGEWEKVLKRFYRLAALSRSRFLRRRCISDVLRHPGIVARIADYMRCTGTADEYLKFAIMVWAHEEQVYPDVNLAVAEGLLKLEADWVTARDIRAVAVGWLRTPVVDPAFADCTALAPLLILKFGDRRSLPRLSACIERKPDRLPATTVRAAAVVFSSYGRNEFNRMRQSAAKLMYGELAEMVRMIERIFAYNEVPQRFAARIRNDADSVAGRFRLDVRSVLTARLLSLNGKPKVLKWLRERRATMLQELSEYDRQLLRRLLPL
jgi:hypothetical protein